MEAVKKLIAKIYNMEKVKKLSAQIYALVGLFTILQNIIPRPLLELFARGFSFVQNRYFPNYYIYIEIPEFYENVDENVVYNIVRHYLTSLDAIHCTRELTVFRFNESSSFQFSPDSNELIQDSFQGANVWWSHNAKTAREDGAVLDKGMFTLKIKKRNQSLLFPYFDHIANAVAEFHRLNKRLTMYHNKKGNEWIGTPFDHPSTFDSLALDPMTKDKIIRDLDRFRQSKQFYKTVGRAWKRGYFLHGPPGTGKSSLVAAISNYMKYDVYDLDLTQVSNNSALRSLLINTTNQSIIVIEDIDCSIHIKNRLLSDGKQENANKKGQTEVTLSGILNFADGLWSCFGEERIIIFTTNYKEKLDPALLRSGRMDMHILLSYCTFPVFKSLASTYLQIDDDPLFSEVEEIMKKSEVQMTPAEMSEIMIKYVHDPVQALNAVISALNDKRNQPQLSNLDNGGECSSVDESSECSEEEE